MSDFIYKDKQGMYVFDDDKFFKSLPKGLRYFAVDEENEKIYNLGKDAFKYYKQEIAQRDKKIYNQRKEIKTIKNKHSNLDHVAIKLRKELIMINWLLDEYDEKRSK